MVVGDTLTHKTAVGVGKIVYVKSQINTVNSNQIKQNVRTITLLYGFTADPILLPAFKSVTFQMHVS
jgi:hypothetical protein